MSPPTPTVVQPPPRLLYYHGTRTHLSLAKDAPEPRPVERLDEGRIVETPMVGGLHHRYGRRAA
jgi:putative transposase